ncbi:GIY-YIG nuclease family protein [Clostridium tepidum]
MGKFYWAIYNACDYRTIYFLMNPKNNQVYVGQTKRNLKSRVREHIQGYSDTTRSFIEIMKDNNIVPVVVDVETSMLTEQDAYVLELIWIKILRENNFDVINCKADIRNSENLFERYIPKYEKRKGVNIYELCNNQKREIQGFTTK